MDRGAYDFPEIAEYRLCLVFVWATSNVIWNISRAPLRVIAVPRIGLIRDTILYLLRMSCKLVTLPHYYLTKHFGAISRLDRQYPFQLTVAPTDLSHTQ